MTPAERSSMLQVISDLSKDAHGFRVRLNYDAMSDAELSATWDGFMDTAEQRNRDEARAHIHAQRVWEQRMVALATDHDIPLADAIRWDMQAFEAEDVGYYCYLNGLAYELEPRIEKDLVR